MDGNSKLEKILELLSEISNKYEAPCLSSSLSAEDMVITDLIATHKFPISVFCIDTGRLHHQTYELMQRVKENYSLDITVYSPEADDLESYINTKGPNAFYQSVDYRKLCCHIRKVIPLGRALKGKSLWLTGLRKQQSSTRTELSVFDWDENFKIEKCNPLLDWAEDEVWDYIHAKSVPYNKLHDQGYPSIGCEPCTRAIKPSEDVRAGRWWWESPESKECGLHAKGKVGVAS